MIFIFCLCAYHFIVQTLLGSYYYNRNFIDYYNRSFGHILSCNRSFDRTASFDHTVGFDRTASFDRIVVFDHWCSFKPWCFHPIASCYQNCPQSFASPECSCQMPVSPPSSADSLSYYTFQGEVCSKVHMHLGHRPPCVS